MRIDRAAITAGESWEFDNKNKADAELSYSGSKAEKDKCKLIDDIQGKNAAANGVIKDQSIEGTKVILKVGSQIIKTIDNFFTKNPVSDAIVDTGIDIGTQKICEYLDTFKTKNRRDD